MQKLIYTALISLAAASKLKVIHPNSFLENFYGRDQDTGEEETGLVTSSLGNFGHFVYGSSIKGQVHYPIDNKDGCLPFKADHFNQEHLKQTRERKHNTIIMVDRGNCHFVLKAQNIQNWGGALAIIVDNKVGESA